MTRATLEEIKGRQSNRKANRALIMSNAPLANAVRDADTLIEAVERWGDLQHKSDCNHWFQFGQDVPCSCGLAEFLGGDVSCGSRCKADRHCVLYDGHEQPCDHHSADWHSGFEAGRKAKGVGE